MAGSGHGNIFANRADPIPVVRIPTTLDEVIRGEAKDRDGDKTTSVRPVTPVQTETGSPRSPTTCSTTKASSQSGASPSSLQQSIQDRIFSGIISQIIPRPENDDDVAEVNNRNAKSPKQPAKLVERPNFSVGLMSTNFRRFNARIGIVFVFQDRLVRLLTWRHTASTLSFLAIYTLLSLNPHLLPLVPLIGVIFFVMIPTFLARHPPLENDPTIVPTLRGPAMAPATKVKPAPEMSKDFFRNMRDLQNCMEDFSRIHDAVNDMIVPHANFSDEALSSSLFLFLSLLCGVAFIASHLIPWRAVALFTGWIATLIGHPRAMDIILSARNIRHIKTYAKKARLSFRDWVAYDVIFDEPPERRQVEIFELQKFHTSSSTWEHWLYTASPWDPMSPSRVAGSRPKGTQFFEDVQAPLGWEWRGKKWALDLDSREWVEQRLITCVEIETEGERWVYDLPEDAVREMASSPKKTPGKAKREIPRSGWEEGTSANGRGEWRRRRWVRMVERRGNTHSEKGHR